jgi:hypothetical protein
LAFGLSLKNAPAFFALIFSRKETPANYLHIGAPTSDCRAFYFFGNFVDSFSFSHLSPPW